MQMTPLGSSTFDLIFQRTTPESKRGAAQRLWDTYGPRACLYTSRFAGKCLEGAVKWSEEGRAVHPKRPPTEEEVGGLDSERARLVGGVTWDHLAGLVIADAQMKALDPLSEDEVRLIASTYGADAVHLFAHWGTMSLEDLTKLNGDALNAAFDWIEDELTALDAPLWDVWRE